MSKSKKLPRGWRWATIETLCDSIGGGTPSRKNKSFYTGDIPWLTVKNLQEGEYEVSDSSEHITQEAIVNSSTNLIEPGCVIVATRVGLGKVAVNSTPVAINQDLRALRPQNGLCSEFLLFAILNSLFNILKFKQGTTVKGVTKVDLLSSEIPLPPLAAQERIVEILQQADAIQHKRAEACHLADQILPAIFRDMFGDPIQNQRGWPLRRIGSFCRVVRGAHPRPAGDPRYFNGDIPIAYISDVTAEPSRTLRRTKLTVTEDGKRKSRFLKGGTLVVTGNTTTGIPKILGMDCCVHDGFRAFTELTNEVERDYLYWYFRNTVEFYEHLTLGDGLRGGLKVSDYEDFEIPFPPKAYQVQLAETLNRAEDILLGQLEALPMQKNTFSVLLSRAFTGELTAEWETANAEWIAERQSFYERLPRLALLALLIERCERAGPDAVTLVTALMKYVFLTQMEGESRRWLYRFKPNHYGPCAMELYDDLKTLTTDGLIAVESDTHEEKTRITLTDPVRAAALLEKTTRQDDGRIVALDKAEEDSDTPVDSAMLRMLKRRAEILDALRSDVATILTAYGDLDHNALLKTVYEKYPAYAVKSRLRRKKRVA